MNFTKVLIIIFLIYGLQLFASHDMQDPYYTFNQAVDDGQWDRALDIALNNNQWIYVIWLLQNDGSKEELLTSLYKAIAYGNSDIVSDLLSLGLANELTVGELILLYSYNTQQKSEDHEEIATLLDGKIKWDTVE